MRGRCYPWQTNDPSLGQAHTIYQIQDKKQVLVFPDPYTNGKFVQPPWIKKEKVLARPSGFLKP